MKLCINCKHYCPIPASLSVPNPEPLCGHPAVQSPVDGKPERTCESLRQMGAAIQCLFGCNGETIRGHDDTLQNVTENKTLYSIPEAVLNQMDHDQGFILKKKETESGNP